jgi:hypothetical protein
MPRLPQNPSGSSHPQVIIGKHVIETNFRMIFRNKEHLGDEQLFRKRLAEDAQA